MTAWNWESDRFLPSPHKLPKIRQVLKLSDKEYAELLMSYDRARREKDNERLGRSARLNRDAEAAWQDMMSTAVVLISQKHTHDPARNYRPEGVPAPDYTHAPNGVNPRQCFAFRVADTAMSPKFSPGEILFCDYTLRLEQGKPIVFALGDLVLCRLLERKGTLLVLKAVDPAVPIITAKPRQVRWIYRVAMRLSDER